MEPNQRQGTGCKSQSPVSKFCVNVSTVINVSSKNLSFRTRGKKFIVNIPQTAIPNLSIKPSLHPRIS